ncbi:MAG: hypothetical protein ABSF44_06780 [Candidatus Bathyarchaeia archaeon]|jgi:3-isopropylmalate dehydratase small subunit
MSPESGGPLIRQIREQRKRLKEQLEAELDPAKKQILVNRIDKISRTIKKKEKISSRRKRVLSLRHPNLDR